MGYNLTKQAVSKVQSFLDAMAASDTDVVWAVADGVDPSKIAHAIRQGIKAAAQNNIQSYAGLSGKFVVKSTRNTITAELRNKLPTLVHMKVIDKIISEEGVNLATVVSVIIKNKEANEFYFPKLVNPNDELLKQLYLWLSTQGFKIIKNETGVTVTKKDIGDIEWKPKQSSTADSNLPTSTVE